MKFKVIITLMCACMSGAAETPPPLPTAEAAAKVRSQNEKALMEKNALTILAENKSAPNSKRERVDELNTLWFTAPGESIKLNLFSDAQYTALVDRVEMAGRVSVFYCHLEGHPERCVMLAYHDGALDARIPGPTGQMYEIRSTAQGVHRVIELEPQPYICDSPPGKNADPTTLDVKDQPGGPFGPEAITQPVADVMVLFTTEAKNAIGLSAIDNNIALAVGYINEAFNRSGINAKVRLVHKAETTWHTQYGDRESELSWLASNSTVANLRNQYGADLVSIMTTLAGFAYCSDPFSVFQATDASYTFAHELGHNFGCAHERYNPSPSCYASSSTVPWFGYIFTPPGYSQVETIMAYGPVHIDQYSSPLKYFLGVPTGLPEGHVDGSGLPDSADNARRINEFASTVAGWRSPGITVLASPALINNDSQFTFQISGPNNGTYTVEYTADYINWSFLGNYALSGSVSVTDNIGTAPYRFYRAKLGTAYLGTQLGYTKVSAPAGQSMIANQLDSGNNTLASLIPSPPDGTRIWKYDEGYQGWLLSTFHPNGWSSPSMTLHPGEGAVLENLSGQPIPLKFVGEVYSAFRITIPGYPGNWAIRSSPAPQAGLLTSLLNYWPADNSDKVDRMTSTSGSYTEYTWSFPNWSPQQPSIAVGEAFWANSLNSFKWSRVLWLWP